MEIQQYINQKKELYEELLAFIESSDSIDISFSSLCSIINSHQIQKMQEDLNSFLQTLLKIANNHHRQPGFFNKIDQILLYLKDSIKQTMENYEIFDIFQSNKRILLFLIKEKIIIFDKQIYKLIKKKTEPNGMRYFDYFIPEIENFKKIKKSRIENKEIYEESRQQGENDSYICSLIRQDSIEEFILHINRKNITLSCSINPSIFETNPLLNVKNPTLIEYASFFGSGQIFQYLIFNNVKIKSSFWIYSIHSNNSEFLVNQIIRNEIIPKDPTYAECYEESVKCHHNEISDYIRNNLFIDNDEKSLADNFRYYNYFYIPKVTDDNCILYYLLLLERGIDMSLLKRSIKFDAISISSVINSIKSFAFEGCSSIKKVTIHNLVTSIGDYAFARCSSLTQISIPDSVKSIGEGCFTECKSLISISIPMSVRLIRHKTFAECSSLSNITIPNSITKIESEAFSKCASLTSISIPESIVKISSSTFSECTALKNVVMPHSVSSIENFAFYGCSSLSEVKIPNSVYLIGELAFSGCSSLKKISIPSSVIEIKSKAFADCSSLSEIIIHSNSINEICANTFFKCISLKQFVIPHSVKQIKKFAFFGCSSLEIIDIPDSVMSIEESAFEKCSSLVQISIPSSVAEIGEYAFCECISLTKISIPSSVTSIGEGVFEKCASLTQISIPSSIKKNNLGLSFDKGNITEI